MTKPAGKRRIMRTFKLDEISLVGRGAQPHASVVLMKSTGANAGVSKQAPQSGEAQGHAHAILVSGSGTGLRLALGFYEDAEGGHSHQVVRTADGFVVELVNGHAHTLPSLDAIVSGLLEAEPDYDGEPEPQVTGKSAPGDDGGAHRREVLAALRKSQSDLLALTEAGEGKQALAKHAKLVKDAESEYDALAKRYQAKHGGTFEGGYSAVWESARGRELLDLMRTPAPVVKSAAVAAWDAYADKLAKADITEFDTPGEIRAKQVAAAEKAMATGEGQALYKAAFEPEPVADPAAADLDVSHLVKSGETATDAMERIAKEWAFESHGRETAEACFSRLLDTPQGEALYKMADAEQRARSLRAQGVIH